MTCKKFNKVTMSHVCSRWASRWSSFSTPFKRDGFVEHPGGLSSLFFAFTDLVIHSIFNINHGNWTQNDARSYLDPSPLYGSSQAEVNKVHRKDGRGCLREDVFADSGLRQLHVPYLFSLS